MTVIDIDAHFEPTEDWLDEFPTLKAQLPDRLPTDDPRFPLAGGSPSMFAYFVSDDLLRGVPREKRMPIERIVTKGMRDKYDPNRGPEVGYPGSNQHESMVDIDRRAFTPPPKVTSTVSRRKTKTRMPTTANATAGVITNRAVMKT